MKTGIKQVYPVRLGHGKKVHGATHGRQEYIPLCTHSWSHVIVPEPVGSAITCKVCWELIYKRGNLQVAAQEPEQAHELGELDPEVLLSHCRKQYAEMKGERDKLRHELGALRRAHSRLHLAHDKLRDEVKALRARVAQLPPEEEPDVIDAAEAN